MIKLQNQQEKPSGFESEDRDANGADVGAGGCGKRDAADHRLNVSPRVEYNLRKYRVKL